MFSETLERFLIRVLLAVAQMLEQRKHRSLEVRDRHEFPPCGLCRVHLMRLFYSYHEERQIEFSRAIAGEQASIVDAKRISAVLDLPSSSSLPSLTMCHCYTRYCGRPRDQTQQFDNLAGTATDNESK